MSSLNTNTHRPTPSTFQVWGFKHRATLTYMEYNIYIHCYGFLRNAPKQTTVSYKQWTWNEYRCEKRIFKYSTLLKIREHTRVVSDDGLFLLRLDFDATWFGCDLTCHWLYIAKPSPYSLFGGVHKRLGLNRRDGLIQFVSNFIRVHGSLLRLDGLIPSSNFCFKRGSVSYTFYPPWSIQAVKSQNIIKTESKQYICGF